jgi:hypothetical protein
MNISGPKPPSTITEQLCPRRISVRSTVRPPLTPFHLALNTAPLISRSLRKFPAHPRKIRQSTFPSQVPAITNSNHLTSRASYIPTLNPRLFPNTLSLQKNTFNLRLASLRVARFSRTSNPPIRTASIETHLHKTRMVPCLYREPEIFLSRQPVNIRAILSQ